MSYVIIQVVVPYMTQTLTNKRKRKDWVGGGIDLEYAPKKNLIIMSEELRA